MDAEKLPKIPKFKIRRVEKPPYTVDKSRLKRFNSKDTVFERVEWDSSWEGYK